MFFTQDDYKKIQQWLIKNSVKDTKFNEANIPFNGEETITIVQGNQNKKVFLKDLIAQVFNLGISDFINITDKYDAPNISLEEAIKLIPSRARKKGQVITFLDREDHWHIYQFKGVLNQWNVLDTWEDLFDWEKLIIDSILPDEEDLTKSLPDENGNSYLSLKDREYNPEDFSGLGRIILRKNIVEVEDPIYGKVKKNVLYQDMFIQSNTIYEIRYDFDLNGTEITIPEGCMLDFQGGNLKNGTILGQHTCIEAQPVHIFNNITFSGKFNVDYIYTEWFGAKGDGVTDDTVAFNQAISYLRNIGGGIKLLAKTYSTGQIDLVGIRDISIFGIHSSVFPWNSNKISRIQINADCDAAIKLVESYTDHLPTANSKSVLLKDFFLDCNHKANKGISCNQFVTIDSVEVRYSKGDGIVLEASTYPVTIRDCEIYNNDGNGIYVRPEYTTCYTIKDNEVSGNHKWGINIEGGCNILVEQNIMQSNYIGGMKIKLRDRSELFAMEYLQKLLFINNYTERNGLLSVNDDEYEGNPALKIEGINKDGETGAGKIDGIVFIGGMYQANIGKCIDKETGQYTDEDVMSVNSIIEGTWNLINIGAQGLSIDYSKNLDFRLNRHSLPNGVTIGVKGAAADYGDLINVVQDYSVYRHQTTFQLTVGGTNILDTSGTYGVMEGVRINNFMIANYTCSFDNTDTQALGGWLILKINGLYMQNADEMIVGDGIICYEDDTQQTINLPIIIIRYKQANQWRIANYNGVFLKSDDIGKTGKLMVSIRTSRY